jgi:hypothetical protein
VREVFGVVRTSHVLPPDSAQRGTATPSGIERVVAARDQIILVSHAGTVYRAGIVLGDSRAYLPVRLGSSLFAVLGRVRLGFAFGGELGRI